MVEARSVNVKKTTYSLNMLMCDTESIEGSEEKSERVCLNLHDSEHLPNQGEKMSKDQITVIIRRKIQNPRNLEAFLFEWIFYGLCSADHEKD